MTSEQAAQDLKNEEGAANISKSNCSRSKRQSRLGLKAERLGEETSWDNRISSNHVFDELSCDLLGDELLERDQPFELLRRAKLFLSLRRVEDFESLLDLDWRCSWNRENPCRVVGNLLDLFPSLKYSYSSLLPLTARLRKKRELRAVGTDTVPVRERAVVGTDTVLVRDFERCFATDYIDLVVSERNDKRKVRFADVCRSHSIWLDPVDCPIELYKWRLRVQKAICWAYDNGCIPVMMTLTVFHRWHPLRELLNVLRRSWDRFFVSGRSALRRRKAMGLVGYIRRLEITLNDGWLNRIGEDVEFVTNAGWHPHFHVILFVPKDKFETVSDIETRMKKEWVDTVIGQFKAEFGEDIDRSYLSAFERHGLHLSRYNSGLRSGELRPVQDSAYLDKIVGYDHLRSFGADKEMSSDVIKNSKIAFDLLRVVSASNIDLWCEYAIATKGLAAFQFSRPLAKMVDAYFDDHPEKNFVPVDLPPSEVVARLDSMVYRFLYRNFMIPQLKRKIAEGYESLFHWVRAQLFELRAPFLCDAPVVAPCVSPPLT